MRFISLIILVLVVVRCNKPDAPDCFQSKGDFTTESVEINASFNSIILYDNIQLVLTNDTSVGTFYEISGAENLIPDIEFIVKNGELTIENKNSCNWVRSYNDFILHINSPAITDVFNYGTQGVDVNYSGSSLTIEQQNSLADNAINFTGDTLTVNIHTNSGSAAINGSVDYAQLYCNGFSSISTDGLEAKHILANNSGAGSMFVTPQQSLFAYIGGSGNIVYSGESIDLTTELIGSGDVIYSEN